MALWMMLGILAASVVVMGVGLEYQRGWESTPEPLRTWLIERTFPVVVAGPRLHIVNSARRSTWLHQHTQRRLQTCKSPATVIAVMQNERNDVLQVAQRAKVEAVAALIIDGQVTQTKAIKVVFDVTPSSASKRYQDIVAEIKAAVERRQPPKFPPLKPEEKAFRERMGLPVS